MTTLATYTFPSGTNLTGVKLRGFATGRYLNNTGSPQSILFTAMVNAVTIISQAIIVPTSTAAQAWNGWLHVYFNQSITAAGNSPSVGASLDAKISDAVNTGTYTGSHMGANAMQVYSNPLVTFVNLSVTQTISFNLIPAGVSNETLQIDMAYMEAL